MSGGEAASASAPPQRYGFAVPCADTSINSRWIFV